MKYLILKKKEISDVLEELGYKNLKIGAGKGRIIIEIEDSISSLAFEALKENILRRMPEFKIEAEDKDLIEMHERFKRRGKEVTDNE